MLGHDEHTASLIRKMDKGSSSTTILTASKVAPSFISTAQDSLTSSTMESNVDQNSPNNQKQIKDAKSLSEILGIISLQHHALKKQLMNEFGDYSTHLFHNVFMNPISVKDIETKKYVGGNGNKNNNNDNDNDSMNSDSKMGQFSQMLRLSLMTMNDLSCSRLMRQLMLKILSTQFDIVVNDDSITNMQYNDNKNEKNIIFQHLFGSQLEIL